MKMRRELLTPVTLSFLVAMLGAFVWGVGTPANAASTTTSTSVSVRGTVSGSDSLLTTSSTDSGGGGGEESVSFSGKVALKAVVTDDPDFGTTPIVVLTIDLSNVTGVGSTSRTKYVTSNRSHIQRRLRASDGVRFTFPFWPSGTNGVTTSRVGGVSFSLSFDTSTRKLTGATASITSP